MTRKEIRERNKKETKQKNKRSANLQTSTAVQLRVPARDRLVSRYRRFELCLIGRVQGPK